MCSPNLVCKTFGPFLVRASCDISFTMLRAVDAGDELSAMRDSFSF